MIKRTKYQRDRKEDALSDFRKTGLYTIEDIHLKQLTAHTIFIFIQSTPKIGTHAKGTTNLSSNLGLAHPSVFKMERFTCSVELANQVSI